MIASLLLGIAVAQLVIYQLGAILHGQCAPCALLGTAGFAGDVVALSSRVLAAAVVLLAARRPLRLDRLWLLLGAGGSAVVALVVAASTALEPHIVSESWLALAQDGGSIAIKVSNDIAWWGAILAGALLLYTHKERLRERLAPSHRMPSHPPRSHTPHARQRYGWALASLAVVVAIAAKFLSRPVPPGPWWAQANLDTIAPTMAASGALVLFARLDIHRDGVGRNITTLLASGVCFWLVAIR